MLGYLPQQLIGYFGRVVLGLGLALIGAGLGVILGRMGILLFGVTSWLGWLAMLVGGIGVGAGLGAFTAWLWLKGMGGVFSLTLAVAATGAGIGGAWYAFVYGTGVEPKCCASPDMGPTAYSVIGAVLAANGAALIWGAGGQTLVRRLRRRRLAAEPPMLEPGTRDDTLSGSACQGSAYPGSS